METESKRELEFEGKSVRRLSEVIAALPEDAAKRFLTAYEEAYAKAVFEAVFLRETLPAKVGGGARRDELIEVTPAYERWERRTRACVLDPGPHAEVSTSLDELQQGDASFAELAKARREATATQRKAARGSRRSGRKPKPRAGAAKGPDAKAA
ncbi:hypothetical protein [Deinococcus budaensis]|uniref:Uncharacterized protein n=1 Tax=Deinococcus budaensis TaxID=1665626 RepID=A0A7W8GEL5_9DEIO|nr:hypothetical protein [Deinococcus budaensis]MBB5234206.1 hypothetical protein [Deinococcus budaensis]